MKIKSRVQTPKSSLSSISIWESVDNFLQQYKVQGLPKFVDGSLYSAVGLESTKMRQCTTKRGVIFLLALCAESQIFVQTKQRGDTVNNRAANNEAYSDPVVLGNRAFQQVGLWISD